MSSFNPFDEKGIPVEKQAEDWKKLTPVSYTHLLDNGVIAGKGTHRELLENCPVYREIAESQ